MSGYFDHAATTGVDPRVRDAMLPALGEMFGNPSSRHGLGFLAERAVEEAREKVAALLGCEPGEVFFTSGGTEANNTALFGAADAKKRSGKRLVISSVEHSSVLESGRELGKRGFEVCFGLPEELPGLVNSETTLVSCMRANNETGAVYPVFDMAGTLKKEFPGVLFHTDCVQAFGKLPMKLKRTEVDLATVSAHKIYGPKGIGALYIRKGVRITPLLFGGEQQGKKRPGTESVPLIVGFGKAAELAAAEMAERQKQCLELRQRLLSGLTDLPGFIVNSPEDGMENILNFSLLQKGVLAENLIRYLSERELYVSAGSACTKGKPSHVLEALGASRDQALSSLRVSFGRDNTPEDVDRLVLSIREGIERFKR